MSSLQKKNNGCKRNSKLETIEISDKSTNPRCQSQVWQHFGFKVTYKDNGLRFKSSPKVICQASFHRKQETGNKTNPMRYVIVTICYYLPPHMI